MATPRLDPARRLARIALAMEPSGPAVPPSGCVFRTRRPHGLRGSWAEPPARLVGVDEVDILAEALVARPVHVHGDRRAAAEIGDAVHQGGVGRAMAAVAGAAQQGGDGFRL